MTRAAPIHSAKPNTPNVYHDNNQCTERNNIERENIRQGDGGRPLCKRCAELNQLGQ